MNNEIVNSVINNIAEKLGIAVDYVVPALVRYNIANCIISLIWGVISIIVIYISIKTISNIFNKYDDNANIKIEMTNTYKDFERAFVYKRSNVITNNTLNDNMVHKLNIKGVDYYYLCMTLKDLKKEQYTKEDKFNGYFQIFHPVKTGNDTINIMNIEYNKNYYQGYFDDLVENTSRFSNNAVMGIDVPSSTVNCPSDVKSIPRIDK